MEWAISTTPAASAPYDRQPSPMAPARKSAWSRKVPAPFGSSLLAP